jgi:glutamate dehydrogenase
VTTLPDPLASEIETLASSLPADDAESFRGLAATFLAEADGRPLRTRGPAALVAIARDLLRIAKEHPPDERLVRVRNPDDRPGRTVIELVQRDRPFIVDTLRLACRSLGLREELLLHPVIELEPGSPFSLIYAEVSPQIANEDEREAFQTQLEATMADVARVTDDHHLIIRSIRELEANVEFSGRFIAGGGERASKIERFLDWLAADHFVFMGLRRYVVEQETGDRVLAVRPESGLGLLRDEDASRVAEPRRGDEIPLDYRERLDDERIIRIEKSRNESRIHRPGRLDRILVKEHDDQGRISGFAILLGLFTYRALREPGSEIPLLAERLEIILADRGGAVGSHRYKAMRTVFDAMPVEFLLESDIPDVADSIEEVVEAEGAAEPRLVVSRDRSGRSVYAAVVLPRERYQEEHRNKVRELLARRLAATYMDARTSFIEETTALISYFCTRAEGRIPELDLEALEQEVQTLCAGWEERFVEALVHRYGKNEGLALAARYADSFPEALRVVTSPEDATHDVAALEAHYESDRAPQFAFYFPELDSRETTMLKIVLGRAALLSDLLPVIDHFGIRVIDAQQAKLSPVGREPAVVEAFRVLPLGGEQADLDALAPRLSEALSAAVTGLVPDDRLNGLVLVAGLDWRQIDCIRAYLEYMIQIQGTLTLAYVRTALLENPLAVRLLVRYFEARLAPGLDPDERSAREAEARNGFMGYRDRIDSLNEDRALGGLYDLIDATLRTNFFAQAEGPYRLVLKLDPSRIPSVEPPPPYREIVVHTADVFGVHLRGGAIARGGLRWSDRADDVRVEVLDLMRTQMLKNGLIVPVGAKGGFVIRRTGLSRDEARRFADEQYEIFISGLLDVTDNRTPSGEVETPPGVHRRDDLDPYLVVAADKGTAHLSDTANAVAIQRDFWLGDAFASGGSEGYDHKKYAITARGVWECVLHHFAELGIDAERHHYTVAGIGDMSGDVFGNGLLLARRCSLVAAFDHRHVFLDPDPDPERSFEERKRLFEMRLSSWADYDASKISEGGGVWPRSAKRVPLSKQARALLGIDAEHATGQEVVRAILKLRVDLLFNGGIGTYVKASHESHAEVGDRTNDAVRIDASELRASVIGEGGNLGLTMDARVEAAAAGVRVDMDSIHNSAGVDLSDHEVNLKILLQPAVRSGRLDPEARHGLLFDLADDVCERVLAHNRCQSLALSLDLLRSQADLGLFEQAIDYLFERGSPAGDRSDIAAEVALEARRSQGQGLYRPELARLLGLAKLQLREDLAGHDELLRREHSQALRDYFPARLVESQADDLDSHPLATEITALVLTNRLIDYHGVALLPSLALDQGVSLADAAFAALAAEDALEVPVYRDRLIALGHDVPRETVYTVLLQMTAAVADVARLLLGTAQPTPGAETINGWRAGLRKLREKAASVVSPDELQRTAQRAKKLRGDGLPKDLAGVLATLPLADRALNIVHIAERSGSGLLETASIYARLRDRAGLESAYDQLAAVQAEGTWERLQVRAARGELLDLQRELTARLLEEYPDDPLSATDAFLAEHAEALARVGALSARARESQSASAAAVVVQALARALTLRDGQGTRASKHGEAETAPASGPRRAATEG